MKRIVTLQRTDTPDAVSRALTSLETAVNSLGTVSSADLPERVDTLESTVKNIQTEQDAMEQELAQRKNAKLTPNGYIVGYPYDGSQDQSWAVDGTSKAKPTSLVARDGDGASEFVHIKATGKDHEVAQFERSETTADNRQLIQLMRNGNVLGIIGLDDHDRLCLFKADGTTVYSYLKDTDGTWVSIFMQATSYFDQDGNQVVTHQQAAIPLVTPTTGSPAGTDTTGGSPSDPATLGDVQGVYNVTNAHEARIADLEGTVADLVTGVNTLIGTMRSHGLIAP